MNKNWLGLIVLILMVISCNQKSKTTQTDQQDSIVVVSPTTIEEKNQLAEVITRFVRAYASKDNSKANALIHPSLGIYIIFRPGAADNFVHVDSLDFARSVPEVYAYGDFSTEHALTFESLPVFDCGTEKWDKQGFFCDTTAHPNQLSNIAAFEEQFNETEYSDEELEELEKSEKESYRVIVTGNAVDPLIFHVRKYQGSWYVTTLDRAYGGCDA